VNGATNFYRPKDGAFICSYECTFCPACTDEMKSVCPNCGGELLRRPRRKTIVVALSAAQNQVRKLIGAMEEPQ
jgi:hypothetical protein